MATKTISLLVCDECGSDEGVRTYRIQQAQRKKTVDLCLRDSEVLEKYLHRRRRRAQREVVSIQEVERRKVSAK